MLLLCSFDRTSGGVTMFSRDVKTNDLIQMAGGDVEDSHSIIFIKHEESVFISKILQRSRGLLKLKLDFNDDQSDFDNEDDSTVNKTFDFGKDFESNGSYLIQKLYCKQRARRNVVFADLKALNVEKATLLAKIDPC